MEPPLPKKAKLDENGTIDIKEEMQKFEHWEWLPLELRCMIAKETNVMTRFSLMFSSKSNYQIARSVPIKIESIRVGDEKGIKHPGIDPEKRNIHIELKKCDPSEVITTVCFVEDGDGTIVHRYWKRNSRVYSAKTMLFPNTSYYDASMSFMEKLMKLTDYQVDEIDSVVSDWGYDVVFLDKLRIKKKLYVSSSDGRTFNRWMNTANSPLEKLKISIPSEQSSPFRSNQFHLNHNSIVNSKALAVINNSESLEHVDFFQFKSDKFWIYGPEVTPEAVNRFIKRWVNGDGPKNFKRGSFLSLEFSSDGESVERSLDGLDYKPWNHKFKVHNKSLFEHVYSCSEHSAGYYIETKKRDNGAALVFGIAAAVILVTGKQESTEQDNSA